MILTEHVSIVESLQSYLFPPLWTQRPFLALSWLKPFLSCVIKLHVSDSERLWEILLTRPLLCCGTGEKPERDIRRCSNSSPQMLLNNIINFYEQLQCTLFCVTALRVQVCGIILPLQIVCELHNQQRRYVSWSLSY